MEIIRVDHKADNTDVALAVGQELEVTLGENPSTGFRWELLSPGEPHCGLVADNFEPPSQAVPGRGGTHRWRFKAASAGSGKIEMAYRRPMEPDQAPARTFKLSVRVG